MPFFKRTFLSAQLTKIYEGITVQKINIILHDIYTEPFDLCCDALDLNCIS